MEKHSRTGLPKPPDGAYWRLSPNAAANGVLASPGPGCRSCNDPVDPSEEGHFRDRHYRIYCEGCGEGLPEELRPRYETPTGSNPPP